MSEKVVKYDEVSLNCGTDSVRIESIEDLQSIISARSVSMPLAAEQFNEQTDPLRSSRLDYSYDAEQDNVVLSGYVEFEKEESSVWSDQQVMNALYEYLVDELDTDENQIDESYSGDSLVLTVLASSGAVVNFSYDSSEEDEPRVLMHAELESSLDNDERYEIIADCMRMWGDLHDLVRWMNKDDIGEVENLELVIKKMSQPPSGFTLWQVLLDYEAWRNELDTATLPSVDHQNINVGRVGLALTAMGRDDYDTIHDSLRSTVLNLRKHSIGKISEAHLIIGLTS